VPAALVIIGCIVAAGLGGIRAVDRLLPRNVTPSSQSYEDLTTEFRPWLASSTMLALALFAAASVAWGLFMLAVDALLDGHAAVAFDLRPARIMFVLPALFLGMVNTALLHERLMRRRLKERYSDFWSFEIHHRHRKRHRILPAPSAREYLAERRGLVFLTPLLAVASLVLLCLTVDTYAYVTPTEIVVNPFLGLRERHYRFGDVASVHMRLAGRRQQLDCVIDFKDGSSFSTQTPPSRLTEAETRALAGYVFDRTRAALAEIE
jgi:hypothetical protein